MSSILYLALFGFQLASIASSAAVGEDCGTDQNIQCDAGLICAGFSINCDPICGGQDCTGTCYELATVPPQGFCGGIGSQDCTESDDQCITNPAGDCSPNCGAPDCTGMCVKQLNVACTDDAKLCPDGSFVSRIGPRCEFPPCPAVPASEGEVCGGKENIQCEADLICGGFTSKCDPACQGVNCEGNCYRPGTVPNLGFCGGFPGESCPDANDLCINDPSSDCSNNCGADCGGICVNPLPEIPQCEQPFVTGPCKALFRRWGFNPDTLQCEMFTYGGCQGNDNNFRSEQDCLDTCRCEQPIVTGPCRASFPSWGYNPDTNECQEFIYGGCQGNGNRFNTKEECEGLCVEDTNECVDAFDKCYKECASGWRWFYLKYCMRRCIYENS